MGPGREGHGRIPGDGPRGQSRVTNFSRPVMSEIRSVGSVQSAVHPENIDNRVRVITDPLYTELTDPLNGCDGID